MTEIELKVENIKFQSFRHQHLQDVLGSAGSAWNSSFPLSLHLHLPSPYRSVSASVSAGWWWDGEHSHHSYISNNKNTFPYKFYCSYWIEMISLSKRKLIYTYIYVHLKRENNKVFHFKYSRYKTVELCLKLNTGIRGWMENTSSLVSHEFRILIERTRKLPASLVSWQQDGIGDETVLKAWNIGETTALSSAKIYIY